MTKREAILIRLPAETKTTLEALRFITDRPLNTVVVEAVNEYLGDLPAELKKQLRAAVRARKGAASA